MDAGRFDKDEVLSVLSQAGNACTFRVVAFLVGGGAMAFRGEKDATKDVDLILETESQAEELGRVFQSLGFEVNIQPPIECKSLVDAKILTASKGMRIDIFVRQVCGKLTLSEGMVSRSEHFGDLGNLSLSICSREDIFLLKSVTERYRDLDDMIVIYRKGIDKNILFDECEHQSGFDDILHGRIWEAFLFRKIEELEGAYSISVPWKKELETKATSKLVSRLILSRIEAGDNSIKQIAKTLGIPEPEIRRTVRLLEKDKKVIVDSTKRPFVIRMAK